MVDLIKARGPLGGAVWHRSCGGMEEICCREQVDSGIRFPKAFSAFARYWIGFRVIPSNVSEEEVNGVGPADLVMRLAHAKAADVACGVDDGSLSGRHHRCCRRPGSRKPVDSDDAFSMLRALSARAHQVYSGVSVIDAGCGDSLTEYEMTTVKFRALSDESILRYVETGEPMGKAGAYAIQGIGGLLVESIAGDYNCVVGFLGRLALMLRKFGYVVL